MQRLDAFDAAAANALFARMRAEAGPIVRRGAGDAPLTETRSAFMRYRGQGREIAVPLPARAYRPDDAATLHAAFEDEYRRLYHRIIPGVEVEVLSCVQHHRQLAGSDAPDRAAAIVRVSQPNRVRPAVRLWRYLGPDRRSRTHPIRTKMTWGEWRVRARR